MTSLSPNQGGERSTMRDVARLAGVGIKTVSRVMNGEPNVSASTQERVRQAAAALRYVPDVAAGNLRRSDRRSRILGLLVGDVMDPFFAEITRAVEDVTVARGLALLTSSTHEDEAVERTAVDAFLQRRVDGLILACASPNQAYLALEHERGLPMVFFDRMPVGVRADAVVTANSLGANRAVGHLVRHGHRRIAGLFDSGALWTAQERLRGFEHAAARSGLRDDETTVVMDIDSEEAASRVVQRLLQGSEPPTALLTGRGTITIGAIRALRHLGLQHEVALVGFDDLATADLLEPAVTVVAQRVSHIGRLAVDQVLARIDGRAGPAATVEVDVDLIERGSGELPPRS